MNIAIIGAGLSGANIVRTLLTHSNFTKNDTITIYEPREELGSGLPYYTLDDETIMLNIEPDVMSVVPSNPNDFNEWLEANYGDPTNFEGLVSRPKYGRYLVERFTPHFKHPQVRHIQAEAEDLEVLQGENHFIYKIKTSNGWESTQYDAVFLSIGHPPYNNFYNLIGEDNYIQNPYPMNEKLSHFDNNQKIGVIGSGATGIDLMRYFDTNYDLKQPLTFYDIKKPFYFVNIPYNSGDVVFTISMEWIEAEKQRFGGFIPFDKILRTVKEDITKEGVNLENVYNTYKLDNLEVARCAFESKDQNLAAVQQYFSRLVPYLPHLYNALSDRDKEDYLKNYHGILSFFKSRTPYGTYQWLFELIDANKVKGSPNTQDIIAEKDGTFTIEMADGKTETADILVNASGFDANLSRIAEQSPLIKNLYQREIILPHLNGRFVKVDWPTLNVVNQRYGIMDNLFFTGLLVGGAQHENNDARLTMRQASYTAQAFMDQFSS